MLHTDLGFANSNHLGHHGIKSVSS